MAWREYGEGLEEKLSDLHGRIHRRAYRAKPQKTIGKRMAAKLKEVRQKLRKSLHAPAGNTVKWLKSVVATLPTHLKACFGILRDVSNKRVPGPKGAKRTWPGFSKPKPTEFQPTLPQVMGVAPVDNRLLATRPVLALSVVTPCTAAYTSR